MRMNRMGRGECGNGEGGRMGGRGMGRGMHRGMKMAAMMAAGFGEGLGEGPGFGGRGGMGGRGFGGRGGGRRRMFAGGELRLVLLRLVADESRHGYDLIKAIEELTGGEYAPSPGVVYPTLSLLLDEGMIAEAEGEGARKPFVATDAGRKELDDNAELVQSLLDRLGALGEELRTSPVLQIHRAMDNLRGALRTHRHSKVDQSKVEAIVDILDDAARRIERL